MDLRPSRGVRKLQGRRAWLKRPAVALPLLCLLIFGIVIGARLSGNSVGASAASLVALPGHVPSLVKISRLVGAAAGNQSLSLSVGLNLRNIDSLKSYINSQSKAHTVTKHHLKPSEVAAAYAPLASSQQSVITYLQGHGFTVTLTVSQHLVIGVRGTVADAESAFHLQINNYRSSTGQDFYAPASNPLVPANLAGLIQSISGLDNVRHFTRPPVKSTRRTASAVKANAVSCLGPGSNYYLPSQLATGYNLTGLYNAGYHGEGQTIGLVEFDNYTASDISTFANCYGGASVPINRVLVDEGLVNPAANAIEVELDMETILSAAPKLAALNVYEAPNSDTGAIDMWSQIISNDAIPVVSTSWGVCEPLGTSTVLQQENTLFTLAAAQGQTIVAAAGDFGTNDCRVPLGNTSPAPFQAVDDPASQPFITGVGGTTLTLNGDNSYNSETVWNNGVVALSPTVNDVLAGGGGLSTIWSLPSWQSGPGVTNSFSNGHREVPDVSLSADPNRAYLVYCSVAATGCIPAGFYVVGGTSAAAPMWAAFIALTNEKILHDGGFNIGFLNPFLYQIDQSAGGTTYGNDFHDITVGNNDGLNDGTGVYPATAHYDMASGLGSYNALNLASDLETLANTKNGARGAPANTTWYFAEGSVGGQFTEYLTLLNPDPSHTAHVSVQYLFENQAAVTRTYTVAASTRFTVNVDGDLGIAPPAAQQAISAIVNSDVPIVAERPMYFNRPADLSASGTDVLGATHATNTTFYFAAGDTNQTSSDNSKEFITILNPNTSTAAITATFYSGGQVVDTETLNVLSLHRGTITTSFRGLAAIKVTSSIGVVVERPIYFKINVPTAGGTVTGAASTVAATTPGGDWLFAEGHTADNFQENLVLANFNASTAASATINLEYTNGSVQVVPVTVNAQSQLIFDVNNAFLHPVSGFNGTTTADVSIEVTSTSPIVAERVMYFKYKGAISGGTDVVGEPGPSSHSIYSFAEGYTTSSFEEWLTLQNPNAHSEVVDITLFFDGTIVQKEITLAAHSRTTININSIVTPVATAYPSTTAFAVSMDVQVFGGTVVAERPLYFNYTGVSHGGTDIIGYTGN